MVVTALLEASRREDAEQEGTLIDFCGPQAEELCVNMAFSPSIGDIIYAIDDVVVTHLNFNQLTRYILIKRNKAKGILTEEIPLSVTFRRHFIEVNDVYFSLLLRSNFHLKGVSQSA